VSSFLAAHEVKMFGERMLRLLGVGPQQAWSFDMGQIVAHVFMGMLLFAGAYDVWVMYVQPWNKTISEIVRNGPLRYVAVLLIAAFLIIHFVLPSPTKVHGE
jgi:hypothetical protein